MLKEREHQWFGLGQRSLVFYERLRIIFTYVSWTTVSFRPASAEDRNIEAKNFNLLRRLVK